MAFETYIAISGDPGQIHSVAQGTVKQEGHPIHVTEESQLKLLKGDLRKLYYEDGEVCRKPAFRIVVKNPTLRADEEDEALVHVEGALGSCRIRIRDGVVDEVMELEKDEELSIVTGRTNPVEISLFEPYFWAEKVFLRPEVP